MKLTLGFSPCPNDTFMFDALVNGKIDTRGYEFEPVLEDIQTLNEWATKGKLQVSKMSLPAFFSQESSYQLLEAGAALGKGVGPLLVAKTLVQVPDVAHSSIAIPGVLTTANFLLSYAFPEARNKQPMLFSEIEEAVLNGTTDLGVLIHENRFTYHQRGLIKVCDLGEIWEQREKAPIPLGVIAVDRSLGDQVRSDLNELLRASVEYAFAHYPAITDYVRSHAQAMDEQVMRSHIDLYVNNFSIDLGAEGHRAIEEFKKVYDRTRAGAIA